MLVLSRKLGQRFQVGQDIRVTIIRIDRNAVRIGVEAPDGTAIYREELVLGDDQPAEADGRTPLARSA